MRPMVDGLEEEYGEDIYFLRLNALDSEIGQRAFAVSQLPGHPGYLLLMPDGTERWRGFGEQNPETVESILLDGIDKR